MQYTINTDQQETFMKILSGILPHENFNAEVAGDIINELDKFIEIKELYGTQYVFWNIIKNMQVMSLYRNNYMRALTRETFERAVMVGLEEYIQRENFNSAQFFEDYGLTFNLDIQTEREEACDTVYSKLLEEYDMMYDMAIESTEAYSYIYSLKEDIQHGIAVQLTSILGQILTGGVTYNRKVYQGYQDWVKFLPIITDELNRRFANDSQADRYSGTCLSTHQESLESKKKNRKDVKTLYYTGFEVYDNEYYYRTQDIIAVIANEGVGKTRYTIDQLHKMLMAGSNVLFVCGETHKYKIQILLEIYHAYYMYKTVYTYEEVDTPDKIRGYDSSGRYSEEVTEELITRLNLSNMDLYQNESYGKCTIVQSLQYERCEQQLTNLVKRDDINIVIIDHVAALDNTGEWVQGTKITENTAKVEHLFKVEDLLVKELNIMFFNTCHTSSAATEAILRNRNTGVRAGANSSAITKYATFAYLLKQPKEFKKNDQVMLEILKIRDWRDDFDPIVLTRNGANLHVYDEEQQYLVSGDKEINSNLEELV